MTRGSRGERQSFTMATRTGQSLLGGIASSFVVGNGRRAAKA
jgi:hypothetical protein